MAVKGKNRPYRWKEISVRHWLETAKHCGFARMQLVIEELVAQTPHVLEQVTKRVPRRFPAQIADSILKGTARAARLLGEQMVGG